MGTPNIPNGLQVAAYCRSDGANPPSLDDPVNVLSVVRNGAGRYTVTFNDPIPIAERWIGITSNGFPNVFPGSQDPNGLGDDTVRFAFQSTGGVATDIPWQLIVIRIAV